MATVDSVTNDIYEFVIDSDSDSDMSECKDNKINEYTYSVLSIDIGVLNLGLSLSTLDEEFNLIDIVFIDLIDITKFTHNFGPTKEICNLNHTKTFCDWLNHIFQENIFFEQSDFILIEKQPPMGFVAIEQLIFSRWRHKAILISPSSMHKYFDIRNYDYDKRKEYTEKIAKSKITNKSLLKKLTTYHRFHDIADSICLMLYWISKKKTKIQEEKREKILLERRMNANHNKQNMSINEWFECHRYIPRNTI